MTIEELNEATVSKTDAIITKLIKKQQVKFKGFATKIVGAKKCVVTKSKNIMTLEVGDGKKDKEFPMVTIIKLDVASGVITFTLPKGASKILIGFLDRFVSKLVNSYEKEINKYDTEKSISITSTSSSLRIGRGKGDNGANKVVKPGETVTITTKSKKLPTVLESKNEASVDRFKVTTSKDEDGDTVHTIHGATFGSTMEGFLEAIFDTKNNEVIEDWLRNLPMGDTVQDTKGNGFVVSDITDHLE